MWNSLRNRMTRLVDAVAERGIALVRNVMNAPLPVVQHAQRLVGMSNALAADLARRQRREEGIYMPHQGKRECARRRRQILSGQIDYRQLSPGARKLWASDLREWEVK